MIQVDKEKLLRAATKTQVSNGRIHTAFGEVETSVSRMDAVWSGAASQNAVTAFSRLKNNYCSPRYNTMESVARILNCIANGYAITEETNTSLSDRFK